MSHVDGSIIIKVPPKTIQYALEDVEHAPEWASSLQEVWDVKGQGKGCTYRWRYRQKGISLEGTTEILESTLGRFKMRTSGTIPSLWTWTMLPLPGGTELRLTIEYSVPGWVFGSIADKLFVERQNQRDLVTGLENLKARLER